jgi:signal transduction histidine kinase
MLHEFITLNRDDIIARCRAKVASRSIPPPSEAEINHGVPLFLDQLVAALRTGGTSTRAIDQSAGQHGHDLLLKGFTVSQVVHDYGDVCQSITELAMETNAPISTDDFRMLNCCLDEAIASAVTIYQRDSQKAHSDVAVEHGNERIGFLVHELRNLVNTATVAFEVLQTGNVGVGGSTGGVLNRSLKGLRDLIARSLEDVRLTQCVTNRQRIRVASFIEEVGAAATLAANARGITLIVEPVHNELTIDGDRQVLGAALGNLLQNAVKFTAPNSTVTLRVGATTDRILIEVHDECGGLPGDNAAELFPLFEQQSADRTGLGIGLAFSRWGVEANGGRLYARNRHEKGCVFTMDLPRVAVPAAELAVPA